MNLDSINTVADLVAKNEELTPLQQALKALTEVDYEDTRLVTLWLISNMLDFHKERAAASMSPDVDANPLSWAHDAGKLEVILETLKGIE